MEKIQETNFKKSILRTKLFIEDIEEIITKMKSNNLDVEITDSENKYDSLQDLIEHKGKNPKLIRLTGKRKELTFDFLNIRISDIGSHIYINGKPDLISLGYELESFLKNRKRKWYHSFFNSDNAKYNLILNSVLLLVFWLYSNFKGAKFNSQLWLFILVFWVAVFLYSELNPMTNSNIELVKKHELSFYKRNKDKILIGVSMALLGSLITLLIKSLN